MVLESERLRIRTLTRRDLDALHAVWSDGEVMRHLEPPFDRAQSEAFLREAGLSEPPLIYGAVLRENGDCIGHVIFHPFEQEDEYELGWVLRRDCWGQGFAGDLTELLITEGKRLGLRSLVLECAPEQTATRHIAARYGFLPAGTSDGCLLFRKDL